jgi:hypothetical protein
MVKVILDPAATCPFLNGMVRIGSMHVQTTSMTSDLIFVALSASKFELFALTDLTKVRAWWSLEVDDLHEVFISDIQPFGKELILGLMTGWFIDRIPEYSSTCLSTLPTLVTLQRWTILYTESIIEFIHDSIILPLIMQHHGWSSYWCAI